MRTPASDIARRGVTHLTLNDDLVFARPRFGDAVLYCSRAGCSHAPRSGGRPPSSSGRSASARSGGISLRELFFWRNQAVLLFRCRKPDSAGLSKSPHHELGGLLQEF